MVIHRKTNDCYGENSQSYDTCSINFCHSSGNNQNPTANQSDTRTKRQEIILDTGCHL
jgi:hypothetical protein